MITTKTSIHKRMLHYDKITKSHKRERNNKKGLRIVFTDFYLVLFDNSLESYICMKKFKCT